MTRNEKHRNRQGFTLMEMLIVVAIIGVLVAVAIPTFMTQLSSARSGVDLANMRSAYGVASAQYMIDLDDEREKTGVSTYYFDGNALATSIPANYVGYGQSSEKAADIWKDAPVTVSGTPNNGTPGYIIVKIDGSGVLSLAWATGTDYSGLGVTSPAEYLSLDSEAKHDLDEALLNALQNVLRNMTYGDIKTLMAKYNIRKTNAFGNHTCYENIAYSCIDEVSGEIIQTDNRILVKELFDAAGYDTSLESNQQYLITSTDLNNWSANPHYIARIFIDCGANVDTADPSALASNAVVYLNDNGKGKHRFNHDQRVAAANSGN